MEDKNVSDKSKSKILDQQYWDQQYQQQNTGWDMGIVAPVLKQFFEEIENKDIAILIPGCGNTYEAEYLLQLGCTHLTVIDIAPTLVERLKGKFKENQYINIVLGDFFDHVGKYDLIIEQTFFCALPPERRKDYVEKMSELLAPGGRLAGLLFNRPFDQPGPPFGGSKEEYQSLFEKEFVIEKMEPSFGSHPKRMGSELFFIMGKTERD